jgi:hypothetical protein
MFSKSRAPARNQEYTFAKQQYPPFPRRLCPTHHLFVLPQPGLGLRPIFINNPLRFAPTRLSGSHLASIVTFLYSPQGLRQLGWRLKHLNKLRWGTLPPALWRQGGGLGGTGL